MIAASDTVSLAPGVGLGQGALEDRVRGHAWPLNSSGAFVLARAGRPVVRELAEAFSLPVEVARADVLHFVWLLNGLALVNVESQMSRPRRFTEWLQLAVRLAPAGTMPAPVARRRALDTRTARRAFVSSLAATLPRACLVASAATVLAVHFAVILGAGLVGPVLIGLGTGLGLGLHEAAHAALLRGVPSALVIRGRRTYVLHAPVTPGRRAAVALGGPLAVSALGVGLVLGGIVAAAPALAAAGWPLAAHALALTVAGGDGRVACGL